MTKLLDHIGDHHPDHDLVFDEQHTERCERHLRGLESLAERSYAICCPAGAPQCRELSLSTSVLKPGGIRGASGPVEALQTRQGAPAALRPQERGPSHPKGAPGWVSQT